VTDVQNAEAQPKSAVWLVLRVFDEPVEVFKELAARPSILLPMILIVIVTGISAFAIPDAVLKDQTRTQLEAVQERADLSDEEVEERVDRAASTTTRFWFIFVVLSAATLLVMAIYSLVLMLIFGATGPEPIRFKAEFAVMLHAYVIALAGAVLMLLLMRFAGMSNPTLLSLGFLFGQDTSPFLHRLANQITLFGTWNMLLVALGNQILSKGKSFTGPLFIVGGLWLLIKVGLAALGGLGFGG